MKSTLFLLTCTFLLAACGQKGSSNNNSQSNSPASSPASSQTAASGVAAVSEPALPHQDHNPAWKTYTVGSQLTYPPFHYQGEKGEPLGFEMELLTAVAKAGRFNINIQHAPRTSLESTLNDGSIQIWSSTISVSPERSEKMDFSLPFMNTSREVIFVQDTEENKNITTTAHFRNKLIAANKYSTTAPSIIAKLTGSEKNMVVTESYHLSMKELFAGKVDGVFDNELVLTYYLQNNPNAQKTRSILVSDEKKDFAFAVKKGNTEVLEKLNKGLETVKSDGTYQKLVQKWFGDYQM